MVFGPQTLHRLPMMINEVIQTRETGGFFKRTVVDVSFPEIEKFDHLPAPVADGVSAFVSIMEGCSKYCTFCVVPYTRGEEVSRPFEDVLREVTHLANQGVREVNLLGQNVNSYNGKMADGTECDLATLIHCVAKVPGIGRIRYTTSHPVEMTQALIDCYADVPELVSFLHLPVQSGADRILAQMKRGYTAIEYKDIIRRLREVRPEMEFSSDFIVGFPGETDADHEATMKLVRDVHYDRSFSFIYSQRPGTPAAFLEDDVPEKVKKERLYALQALLIEQNNEIAQAMVGKTYKVLVERMSRKDFDEMAGRTDNNWVVNFPGDVELIGQFVEVKITEAKVNSLRGELVATPEAGALEERQFYALG
jgi:tRNA-2-methylthio-N6-dimethylallyladenosine synthase